MAKARLVELRENVEELTEIGEMSIKELKYDHGIEIPVGRAALTIAHVYMKNMIKYLSSHRVEEGEVEVDFMRLMTLGISHRYNDGAEKEGNYVAYIEPTKEALALIKKK